MCPLPNSQKIQGLPEGATLKPIEGLPEGAEVRPIGASAPAEDDRNDIQRSFDENTKTDPNEPLLETGLKSVVGAVGSPLIHPIKTLQGAADLIGDPIETIPKMGESIKQDYKDGGLGYAATKLGGNLFGGLAAGEGAGAAGGLVKMAGPAIERGGLGVVNNALGARGVKMFQHGQNAARGAIDEGVVPAMSKHSASMKIEPAMERVGGDIANAVESSPNQVPLDFIRRSVEQPLREARGIIQGPGGGGRSVAPIDALGESMTARAPNASAPVYGPNAGTRFTADEAVDAMAKPVRALPAPIEETPLRGPRTIEGTPSRPTVLHQPDRPMATQLNAPREEIPMGPRISDRPEPNAGVISRPFSGEEATGMGPGDYLGQISGNRGGVQASPGVLRRPQVFSGPDYPSQFTDLRHGTATPSDLWHTIRNVDENTRFNPDPEVEGLNEVRRSIRGGLRGNLEEAVPGVKAPSQTYSDLATAREALDRTMHGGTSIKRMLDAASFPMETTAGTGLVKMGRAAQRIDPRFLKPLGYAGTARENR